MKKAGKGTRWETRRNALEVLRKILKSVMLCDREVRPIQGEALLEEFADSMLKLAKGMSEVERQRYRHEGLWEKLWGLQDLCVGIDIARLEKIYAVFDGQEVEWSGDEEDEEDEGRSEDDDTTDLDEDDISDYKVTAAD